MITKNFAMKIQKLVVNHESWPIKLNPATTQKFRSNPVTCFIQLISFGDINALWLADSQKHTYLEVTICMLWTKDYVT